MTDTKELAKELARQMKRGELVLTPSDIAIMCSYEPNSTPVRQMLADPTFPAPIALVPGGHKRYRRKDVEAWIDRKYAEESRFVMRSCRA